MSISSFTSSHHQQHSAAIERFIARTPKSAQHHRAARKVLGQEIIRTAALPHPLYIQSARGSALVDLDGNEYLDLTMGFGAHVLGHRPESVMTAVFEQLRAGWQFGLHNTEQLRAADLVCSATTAAEKAVFSNSGTEATMYALRAARAFTGKHRIAIFDGSYHGAHEHVTLERDPASPPLAPTIRPIGRGVAPGVLGDVLMLPYLSAEACEMVAREADTLAMVLVQGIQNRTPHLGAREWLRALRDVCRAADVLFCLDEVVSGFRIAFGGCEENFCLNPDLLTYGKGMGGGFPIGVTVGRADIMELFHDRHGSGGIFAGGTFNGNPTSMVAAAATIAELRSRGEGAYQMLNTESDRLAASVNRFCVDRDIPATFCNAGSIMCLRFAKGPFLNSREVTNENMVAHDAFLIHLLEEGVIMPPLRMCFLSMAHSSDDVDRITSAICHALLKTKEDRHFDLVN